MTQNSSLKTYNALISPSLPDIVRFARQRELKEMEEQGEDLSILQSVEEPQMYPFLLSVRSDAAHLPDLVRFAREREQTRQNEQRSDDYYLTPWDGLRSNAHMHYLYHHAEPLMPLRGRDLDVMDGFFGEEDPQDFVR